MSIISYNYICIYILYVCVLYALKQEKRWSATNHTIFPFRGNRPNWRNPSAQPLSREIVIPFQPRRLARNIMLVLANPRYHAAFLTTSIGPNNANMTSILNIIYCGHVSTFWSPSIGFTWHCDALRKQNLSGGHQSIWWAQSFGKAHGCHPCCRDDQQQHQKRIKKRPQEALSPNIFNVHPCIIPKKHPEQFAGPFQGCSLASSKTSCHLGRGRKNLTEMLAVPSWGWWSALVNGNSTDHSR